MSRSKEVKFRNNILNQQDKYEKLRKTAFKELKILEEYFGKRTVDQIQIYRNILKHLEATQKEISYNGVRGVTLGILTTVLVYIFNTGVIASLLKMKISLGSWIIEAIAMIIATFILFVYFLVMYFFGASSFFIEDMKRRKQIYINEFLIKTIEEKLEEIKDNQK
ncbi:hypothetical protein [Bacillus sp. OK048]|uniref:hypothetical protein n=1 Tax=Bacillus sp. OK048 TaxID=1882761 RepID=UPI000890063C|nr:hypothetical protein [Bacillus sp. OK048]SDN56682.1 hypothetical protein SAMN05443253_11426 [Bacillus sp. OK048]